MTPKKPVNVESTGNTDEEKEAMQQSLDELIEKMEKEKQDSSELNIRVTAADLASRIYQHAVPLGEGGDKVADEVLILAQRLEQFIVTGVCK